MPPSGKGVVRTFETRGLSKVESTLSLHYEESSKSIVKKL
jgi:hypothetical protein